MYHKGIAICTGAAIGVFISLFSQVQLQSQATAPVPVPGLEKALRRRQLGRASGVCALTVRELRWQHQQICTWSADGGVFLLEGYCSLVNEVLDPSRNM